MGSFGRNKRRRRRKVSRRLKRAIKRIALSDAQVRYKDHDLDETMLVTLETIADAGGFTTTGREGTAATTGWVSRPLDDIGGITIGTSFDQRESDTVLLLGVVFKLTLKPHVVSATNGITRQWWCRFVWGLHHPEATSNGNNINPRAIYTAAGAGITQRTNRALMPWPTNSRNANYEEREDYHIMGTKVIMVGATNTEDRYSTGWREVDFTINMPIRRKVDFADATQYAHKSNLPFIFAYCADGSNNGGEGPASTASNNGPVVSGEYRLYWKNIN